MRRLLRKPRETFYLTKETAGGRLLLTPRGELPERMLGVLGRARHLYPLDLHAFVFLPDRVELLLTVSSRPRLAGFLGHLTRNLSATVGAVQGWDDSVFRVGGVREVVTTIEQARARLRDIHAAPVMRGLVARPEAWPGASSATALLGGVELVGVWNGASYHVPVEPLPARLGGAVATEAMFREIAEAAAEMPMGPHWVRACEPTLPDPRDPRFEALC
jgi:hypothetical protein